jgi:hypothetical protein
LTHSHGFGAHTHGVPGADGDPVTWQSLLALGISGGLLPCPSALVVMLGAIALHQVALGLILIVAFSTGLAGTLMSIGLLMVYSGRAAGRLRLTDRLGFGAGARLARLVRVMPVLSAGVVSLAGVGLTVEAAGQLDVTSLLARAQPWALPLLAGAAIALTAVLSLRRSRRIPAPLARRYSHLRGGSPALR